MKIRVSLWAYPLMKICSTLWGGLTLRERRKKKCVWGEGDVQSGGRKWEGGGGLETGPGKRLCHPSLLSGGKHLPAQRQLAHMSHGATGPRAQSSLQAGSARWAGEGLFCCWSAGVVSQAERLHQPRGSGAIGVCPRQSCWKDRRGPQGLPHSKEWLGSS